MDLRYVFTGEDYANILRASSRPPWATSLFVLLLLLLFLVGMFLIDHDLVVIGWVWLAMSVALGISLYEAPRIQFRNAMRNSPLARGERIVLIREEGINTTLINGQSQVKWSIYTEYKETAHLFVLRASKYQATYIPKRVMSVEQIEELRQLLKVKIQANIQSN